MNIFSLGWRNIWRNKRRTAITIASVLFAVLFAIVMRAFQEGTYSRAIENMVRMISGHIQVQTQEYWDDQVIDNIFVADPALVQKITKIPGVEYAFPRLQYFAFAATDDVTREAIVVGADLESEEPIAKLGSKFVYGAFPDMADGRSVVISEGLARNLGLIFYTDSIVKKEPEEIADTIKKLRVVADSVVLLGQGYHGATAAGAYQLSGIVKLPIPELNKRVVYMPLSTAQYFFSAKSMLTSINIQLQDSEEQFDVLEQLKEIFSDKDLAVLPWQVMHKELLQQIESDKGSGMITIALLYLIIGFGILGTIIMMVTERKKEFGILVAIGMQKWLLCLQVAIEMILMGIFGVLGGAVLSLPILLYYAENPIEFTGELAKAYESYGWEAVMPVSIELSIFLYQSGIVLALFCLSTMYAYVQIFKLDVKTTIHK